LSSCGPAAGAQPAGGSQMATASIEDVRKILEDLDSEIADGGDALRVIGELDALASAIFSYAFPKKRMRKALSLPQVLRKAAKVERDKKQAEALEAAAESADALIPIADEVSYGELHRDGVDRAENARSELYDQLYGWVESHEEKHDDD
jgi:hypothetical protein